MTWTLHEGDCLSVLPTLASGSIDAIVTDPPYEFGFMGKSWDRSGVAFRPETWEAVLRVLKPGGYLLCFGGTRTYHRLTCAVEDAGFQIRDCVLWLYGNGFPKGQGNLKPAYEPIVLARKPGKRVFPLGIDECRVPTDGEFVDTGRQVASPCSNGWDRPWMHDPDTLERNRRRKAVQAEKTQSLGRYPANVLHDGSDEVLEAFAAYGETSTTGLRSERSQEAVVEGTAWGVNNHKSVEYANEPPGTAVRFFYCAKASKAERGEGNNHPTVKPLKLMRWLVRLITPPGDAILDPFAGSGTAGLAALAEGRDAVMIEREPTYCGIIRQRMADADGPLFAGQR